MRAAVVNWIRTKHIRFSTSQELQQSVKWEQAACCYNMKFRKRPQDVLIPSLLLQIY
jgi:hypothetical protein